MLTAVLGVVNVFNVIVLLSCQSQFEVNDYFVWSPKSVLRRYVKFQCFLLYVSNQKSKLAVPLLSLSIP